MSQNNVDCIVWFKPTQPGFLWPEQRPGVLPVLLAKDNFGIALSGGGMRAASLQVGVVRALRQLGYFQKARYISSNSGGSWLNGPLGYISDSNLDTFLGPYYPPEQLTTQVLNATPAAQSFESCIVDAEFTQSAAPGFFDSLLPGHSTDPRDFWSKSVGGSLKSRPLPIINGSVVIGGSAGFMPVEFTPLYYGVPVDNPQVATDSLQSQPFSGILIQPHGFTSSLSTATINSIKSQMQNAQSDSITVSVPKTDNMISVPEQAGISSSAVAQGLHQALSLVQAAEALNMPVYPTWSALSGYNSKICFSDGGGTDNEGLLALIRRGVTKAISFNSLETSDSLTTSRIENYVGLFGRETQDFEGITAAEFNAQRQVFPSSAYDELLAGLQRAYHAGGPVAYLLRTTVLPNPRINVTGNYNISVLFILNADCSSWSSKLPAATQQEFQSDQNSGLLQTVSSIVGSDEANLYGFPFINTAKLNYSARLTHALSQLGSWQIFQSQDLLHQLNVN